MFLPSLEVSMWPQPGIEILLMLVVKVLVKSTDPKVLTSCWVLFVDLLAVLLKVGGIGYVNQGTK
jgi:hypothetical protein